MNVSDFEMGQNYRITADDIYKGRVAKAVGLVEFGDVILEFKSGGRAIYHPSDLEVVE